jgi:hypothetical protein
MWKAHSIKTTCTSHMLINGHISILHVGHIKFPTNQLCHFSQMSWWLKYWKLLWSFGTGNFKWIFIYFLRDSRPIWQSKNFHQQLVICFVLFFPFVKQWLSPGLTGMRPSFFSRFSLFFLFIYLFIYIYI